jgi:hypothetical protein
MDKINIFDVGSGMHQHGVAVAGRVNPVLGGGRVISFSSESQRRIRMLRPAPNLEKWKNSCYILDNFIDS